MRVVAMCTVCTGCFQVEVRFKKKRRFLKNHKYNLKKRVQRVQRVHIDLSA